METKEKSIEERKKEPIFPFSVLRDGYSRTVMIGG